MIMNVRINSKHLALWMASAALVLVLIVWNIGESHAQSGQPGSADDPLVTKSYVDQVVAELVRRELANFGGSGGGETALDVVTVPPGYRLMVAGGGEIVVRSGKASAYSADANGLSDLTEGKDIAPGQPVPANHLILFPRDGRGIQADPGQKGDVIVLVRGAYEIRNA